MKDESANKDDLNPFLGNRSNEGQNQLYNEHQKDQIKKYKLNRKRKENNNSLKTSSIITCKEHDFSFTKNEIDYGKLLSSLRIFSIYLGFTFEKIEESEQHLKLKISMINDENNVIFDLKFELSNKEVVEYNPITIELNDPDEDTPNFTEKLLIDYECVHNLFKYFFTKVYSN